MTFSNKVMNYISLTLFCAFLFSCSPTEPDAIGEHWDILAGTVWYNMDGNGMALNRWTFYEDSLIVETDEFYLRDYAGWKAYEVRNRRRMWAGVSHKDKVLDGLVDYCYKPIGTYRCTELQWKRQWPALTGGGDWAFVYDWSVYQWWHIEYVTDTMICFGDTPNCYELTKRKPIELIYRDGFMYDKL